MTSHTLVYDVTPKWLRKQGGWKFMNAKTGGSAVSLPSSILMGALKNRIKCRCMNSLLYYIQNNSEF